MNQKIERVRNYLAEGKDYKRWRLWHCFQGPDNERQAAEEIITLRKRGFKAKRWAPLPHHYSTGHVHIVVLATFQEFCDLAGITDFLNLKEAQEAWNER